MRKIYCILKFGEIYERKDENNFAIFKRDENYYTEEL